MNRYEIVYNLLEAGATYTTNETFLSLTEKLENRAVHPESPEFEWRNKVVNYLRDQGVDVTPKEWSPKDQPKIINVVTE